MMSFLVHKLYLLAVLMVQVYGSDPNYRNIFYQTTKEVQNVELSNIQGEVPDWIDGDFVRQNCASYGDIDGGLKLLSYLFSLFVSFDISAKVI